MLKFLKDLWHDLKIIINDCWKITLIILVISAVMLFIVDDFYKYVEFLSRSPKDKIIGEESINAFHAVEITILTFILILVAWVQLKSLNKTGSADFLLRLDERFTNKDILAARIFLHSIYIQHVTTCTHSDRKCASCHEAHMQSIRNYIYNIRHDSKFAKEFMQLRNLLELFETYGYFEKKGYLDKEDINQLLGGTVVYHYEVFRDWITYSQENKDSTSFQEFERLVSKIKPDLIPESRRNKY